MVYTKEQLIQAFCEVRNCQAKDLPKIEEQVQKMLDNRRASLTQQLQAIPLTAKEQMKKIAIAHLSKKTSEQAAEDSKGVGL